jgi:hypothetical protein
MKIAGMEAIDNGPIRRIEGGLLVVHSPGAGQPPIVQNAGCRLVQVRLVVNCAARRDEIFCPLVADVGLR